MAKKTEAPPEPAAPKEKPEERKLEAAKRAAEEGSGLRRAAMLFIGLGTEVASAVSRHLSDDEIERITAEIISMGSITADQKRQIMKDFSESAVARNFISQGGEAYAREMLISSLGERKAKAIMSRFRGSGESNCFGLISNVDPPSLAAFLKNEHPQTIALVLSTLPTDQAAKILVQLPEDKRTSVAYRMATVERPSPEVIAEIQSVLGEYVQADFQDMGMSFGGTSHVAETFNEIEQSIWKTIIDEIEEFDPNIASEIKTQMFTFGDLILLDNKSIQAMLKEVDSQDLALALKGATSEVKDLVYRNMSKRASAAIKEEMEYMGAVRISDVEAAQQRIIEVVRKLESEGAVYIAGHGGEEGGYIE
jgi:flagellar motor switch protein FliG